MTVIEKRYNKRSRYLRISVYPDQRIIITIPTGLSQHRIDKFIQDRQSWIDKHIKTFKKMSKISYPFSGRKAYLKYKEKSRRLIEKRVKELSNELGLL